MRAIVPGDTAFNATISNLGWAHRWIIHPHGDGHHSLHHLWSSVPHHQIAKMHLTLAELDKALGQKVSVKEHGKARMLTKAEVIITQLVNKAAANGDPCVPRLPREPVRSRHESRYHDRLPRATRRRRRCTCAAGRGVSGRARWSAAVPHPAGGAVWP